MNEEKSLGPIAKKAHADFLASRPIDLGHLWANLSDAEYEAIENAVTGHAQAKAYAGWKENSEQLRQQFIAARLTDPVKVRLKEALEEVNSMMAVLGPDDDIPDLLQKWDFTHAKVSEALAAFEEERK